MCFEGSKAFVRSVAGPHYPAPVTAVEVMQKAAFMKRNEALNVEREDFVRMAKTPVAHGLISIFLGDQYLKKKAKSLTKDVPPMERVSVIGAGIMGGGIFLPSSIEKRSCNDEGY